MLSHPGETTVPIALEPENRARLGAVSTATLTTVLYKRGLRNTYMQNVGRINPSAPNMVGEAFTLRYIPAREDIDHLGVYEDWEHPQRKAVESMPAGQVLVIDSRGDARSASAGDILITRLMKRGAAGVVTDGGFRDSGELASLDFPVYHQKPSAPTSPIHHHAVDLNRPIGCGGVAVYPGDLLVGDTEGVVVIPAEIANEVAEEAHAQTRYEDFVLEKVNEGRSIFGIYPAREEARAEFEQWLEARRADP
jgi:regulator of RNase E activity RraA